MAKKNDNNYFNLLIEMAECADTVATKLEEILKKYRPDDLKMHMEALHEVESKGDNLKHNIAEKLRKEFITPLDREDFLGIAGEIDDVIDSVEDVLINMYMFNIKSIRPEAIEFAELTTKCCNELLCMMKSFDHYKKSTSIHNYIVEINRLEELGDDLYTNSIHRLFSEKNDAVDMIAWTEIFRRFEKCCDTCEHVANWVENIIMKNT